MPITAIVIGLAGNTPTETTLCGTKLIESTATNSPLINSLNELSAYALALIVSLNRGFQFDGVGA
ncbi:MAG: hypothetical protein ACR2NZ_13130 [Rubripirellula sp.]